MDPTKINLPNLPWGLCPDCLERMNQGSRYDGVKLPDGTVLVTVYCEHREAGALGILRPGAALRWKIETPIDVLAWQHGLQIRVPALARAFAELKSAEGAGSTEKR